LETLRNEGQIPSKTIISYLEYIIQDLEDKTPDFHNKLVIYYIESLLEAKNSKNQEVDILHVKLCAFLDESGYYEPHKIIPLYNYEEQGLHEERAILFSKIGYHSEALKEYIHVLNDFKMAEEYCERHYNPGKEGSKDVFLQLLKVFFIPPDTQNSLSQERLFNAAFDLLDRHYKEIDTPHSLMVLPDETKINKLYPFFENVLRESNNKRRNGQIQQNIIQSEVMRVKSELIKLRSRVVKINENSLCHICDNPLNESAFAFYPNGTVVHYNCYQKMDDPNVCPITKERFGGEEDLY